MTITTKRIWTSPMNSVGMANVVFETIFLVVLENHEWEGETGADVPVQCP